MLWSNPQPTSLSAVGSDEGLNHYGIPSVTVNYINMSIYLVLVVAQWLKFDHFYSFLPSYSILSYKL